MKKYTVPLSFINSRNQLLRKLVVFNFLGGNADIGLIYYRNHLLRNIFVFNFLGGNADMLSIWDAEGRPYILAVHACFGFGGIIAPLVTEPFLSKKFEEISKHNVTEANITGLYLFCYCNTCTRSYDIVVQSFDNTSEKSFTCGI